MSMPLKIIPERIKKTDLIWFVLSNWVIIDTCHKGYAPIGWFFFQGHFLGYFGIISEILFFGTILLFLLQFSRPINLKLFTAIISIYNLQFLLNVITEYKTICLSPIMLISSVPFIYMNLIIYFHFIKTYLKDID